MVAQKSFAGRLRRQKYLLGVILLVVFLLGIQLCAYKQTRFEHANGRPNSGKTFKALLKTSWFRPDHVVQGSDVANEMNHRDEPVLRAMLQAIDLCKKQDFPQTEDTANVKCSECLTKLFAPYLTLPPHLTPSDSDNSITRTLEDQIGSLSEKLKLSTAFLELKDTREPGLSETNTNWFMSALHGPPDKNGFPEELEFPSNHSNGRLLCLVGNHTGDGTQNKYGFAWKGYLPPESTLLPGLTLVADNYWDYMNIWHSMSALVSFVSWRTRKDCVVPERVLLYHWGELVPTMGSWIDNVLHASFGRKLEVEKLDQRKKGPVCLERAVVNRRGLGGMSLENLNSMFRIIRCRARKFCEVDSNYHDLLAPIHVTLLVRSGARAFKNLTAVTTVLEKVCDEVGNCLLEVAPIVNLSFCAQVALMSRTDVLITTHGAQMTNSMFMPEGGSVMEFIPKGWLEFAGVGQYIYKWLADWSNLHHEGVWRDPDGPDCPYPTTGDTLPCFLFHKDLTVGHNETHLREWTREVIGNINRRKAESELVGGSWRSFTHNCTCD